MMTGTPRPRDLGSGLQGSRSSCERWVVGRGAPNPRIILHARHMNTLVLAVVLHAIKRYSSST